MNISGTKWMDISGRRMIPNSRPHELRIREAVIEGDGKGLIDWKLRAV